MREQLGYVLADCLQHALEQRERLLLILVDRRLLSIRAQVNDLTQRVERRQMLLPVVIEVLKKQTLFNRAPGFLAYLLDLRCDRGIGGLLESRFECVRVDPLFVDPLRVGQFEREGLDCSLGKLCDIPLLGI